MNTKSLSTPKRVDTFFGVVPYLMDSELESFLSTLNLLNQNTTNTKYEAERKVASLKIL